MDSRDDNKIAAWVAQEILPHEAQARSWLRRRYGSAIDADDVIQEAYCRLLDLASVEHIANGRSYFFRSVQSVAVDSLRRLKVANLSPVTEIDWLNVIDEKPTAERAVEANQALDRIGKLLSQLSWTCRRVIELRRIEGRSQKETGQLLGITESVVENHVARGLKRVLAAMSGDEKSSDT